MRFRFGVDVRVGLILIILILPSYAAASSNDCVQALVNPFLFRVEKNGRTSHLFGTMHVEVNLADLPPVVQRVLGEATHLSIEATTLSARSQADLQGTVLRGGGKSLADVLTKAEWKRLKHRLEAMNVPAEIAEELSPFGAILMVSPWFKKFLEDPDGRTLDDQIAASFANRTVRSLENPSTVSRAIEAAFDIERLRYVLGQPDDGYEQLKKIYWDGDDVSMARLMEDERKRSPRWYDLMLSRRNSAWLPKIQARHHSVGQRHVAAVGAGHLLGSDGLIALLRAKKFTVDREL